LGLTLTQKITAQDVSTNLKGFGISIARAADIDMNKYAGKCFCHDSSFYEETEAFMIMSIMLQMLQLVPSSLDMWFYLGHILWSIFKQ
jgi:hypothetical protein